MEPRRRLATLSWHGAAVWDAENGTHMHALRHHSDPEREAVSSFAWSPDGSRVVTRHPAAVVCDAADGSRRCALMCQLRGAHQMHKLCSMSVEA